MQTVNVDEMVEFAWNWAEELSMHMDSNNWTRTENKVQWPGLSDGVVKSIGQHVLQALTNAPDVSVAMKAYTRQLQLLKTIKSGAGLPLSYVVSVEKKDSTYNNWSNDKFFPALDSDIAGIVRRYTALQDSVYQTTAAAAAPKP